MNIYYYTDKKTNGMVQKQILFQEGTFYKIYPTYVSGGELTAKIYCTIVNLNKMDYYNYILIRTYYLIILIDLLLSGTYYTIAAHH